MKLNKKILVLSLLFLTILPIVLLFIFFGTIPNTQVTPPQISPTSMPRVINPGQKEVTVVRTFPEQSNEIFLPIQQVEIAFSQEISADNLLVTVSPEVIVKVGNSRIDPNIIIISPDPVWKEGLTEIIINTKSSTDVILEKVLVYRINTAFPKNAPDVH